MKKAKIILVIVTLVSLSILSFKLRKDWSGEQVEKSLDKATRPSDDVAVENLEVSEISPQNELVEDIINKVGDNRLIPVDVLSDRPPSYVTMVDELTTELLSKIFENVQPIHSSFNNSLFSGRTTWMRGLQLGAIAFQLAPDELPDKGYIGEKFFFYSKKGVDDFSEGFVVGRKDGRILQWDISNL